MVVLHTLSLIHAHVHRAHKCTMLTPMARGSKETSFPLGQGAHLRMVF